MVLLVLLLLPLVAAEFLTTVTDGDASNLPALCQEETVISCTLVTLHLDCLTNATIKVMDAELAFKDQPGEDTFTYASEGAEATFTVDWDLGVVWGHAELADGRDFILEPAGESCAGCHVVIEEDMAAFPMDHAAPPPPGLMTRQTDTAWNKKAAALLAKGIKDKTTMVTYTIKVYYTPEVKKANKDVPTMVNNIIATTNQGYINSKIPIRLKLHCLEVTTKTEAQGMNNIDTFSEHKGSMAKLRGSADTAALLIQKVGQWCGVGYVQPGDQKVKVANLPFTTASVTVVSCGLGTYTFGHEVSHNMGNTHDKYADAKSSSTPNKPAYAKGFHIPGTDYRTIMAYPYGEKFAKTVNYYSNPNLKFKKVAMGDKKEADASRMITEIRFALAGLGDESTKCATTIKPTASTTKPTKTTTAKATTAKTTTVKATTAKTTTVKATTAKPAATTTGEYGGGDYYGGGGYDFYG